MMLRCSCSFVELLTYLAIDGHHHAEISGYEGIYRHTHFDIGKKANGILDRDSFEKTEPVGLVAR